MGISDECFRRTDIGELRDFLLYGTERLTPEFGSFEERLKEAWQPLQKWLESNYTQTEEREDITTLIYIYSGVVQDVYMEIGLKAGIRLMNQALQ